MKGEDILKLTSKYVAPTYTRYPIAFFRGRGCRLWDVEGNEYIDFVSGLGVNNVGHSHPKVVDAIKKQADTLIHVSNLFHIPPQSELASRIVGHTFPGRVFFANSGAEANEAAIKLARKYGNQLRPGKVEIITACNSFHGRTFASLSATAQEKYHKGFQPLLPGFTYVPYSDIAAFDAAINENTCAILIEPIQGEGGVRVPSEDFIPMLRQLCNKHGILMILDEVQTGMGRTGKLFNYQYYGIEPDILTMAKSLGGGVPIGAMLASDRVIETFGPGSHASTFGGNYLACSAGLAVLEVIESEHLLENCTAMSKKVFDALNRIKEECTIIKEVRGKGLMIGIELYCEGKEIVKRCLDRGLIINCTMDNVLRLLPPLIITPVDIDLAMKILSEEIKEYK